MALFIKILLTMFIAEMGDKTQLLLVAMTSRFKLRDIILGSAAAILERYMAEHPPLPRQEPGPAAAEDGQ